MFVAQFDDVAAVKPSQQQRQQLKQQYYHSRAIGSRTRSSSRVTETVTTEYNIMGVGQSKPPMSKAASQLKIHKNDIEANITAGAETNSDTGTGGVRDGSQISISTSSSLSNNNRRNIHSTSSIRHLKYKKRFLIMSGFIMIVIVSFVVVEFLNYGDLSSSSKNGDNNNNGTETIDEITTVEKSQAPTISLEPTMSPTSIEWELLGQDINGSERQENLGVRVSTNYDGNVLAVSGTDGLVRMYSLAKSDGENDNEDSWLLMQDLSRELQSVTYQDLLYLYENNKDSSSNPSSSLDNTNNNIEEQQSKRYYNKNHIINTQTKNIASVSLSSDGNFLVIGSSLSVDERIFDETLQQQNLGFVKVFQCKNNNTDDSTFKSQVLPDMNEPEHTVMYKKENGNNNSKTRKDCYWSQVGTTIIDPMWIKAENSNRFGWSVDISENGRRIAVGVNSDEGLDYKRGSVFIFDYVHIENNEYDWSLTYRINEEDSSEINNNSTIDDSETGFGFSLSLTNSGEYIAIGAPFASSQTGFVSLYKLPKYYYIHPDSVNEEQRMPPTLLETIRPSISSAVTLSQKHTSSFFGFSVSLSKNDGSILAIGIPGKSSARVYSINLQNISDKKTMIINSEFGTLFGNSLSLSHNGERLSIGAPYAHSSTDSVLVDNASKAASSVPMFSSGRTHIYFILSEKKQKQSPPSSFSFWNISSSLSINEQTILNGENGWDSSGESVCLSGNGQNVVIGANGNLGERGYQNAGHVRVYQSLVYK